MYTMTVLYRGTYSLGEYFKFTLPWIGPFSSRYVIFVHVGTSDLDMPVDLGAISFESILARFTSAFGEDPVFDLNVSRTSKDCVFYDVSFPSFGYFGYIKCERCNDEKS